MPQIPELLVQLGAGRLYACRPLHHGRWECGRCEIGRITARPLGREPGAGSRCPLCRAEVIRVQRPGRAIESPAGRILVVAGDRLGLRRQTAILGADGYVVDTAFDRAEAIEKLDGSPYQAVLIDGELPGLGHRHVLERLRGAKANRRTPMVIVAGSHGDGLTQALSAVGVLPKPYTSSGLRSVVHAIIA